MCYLVCIWQTTMFFFFNDTATTEIYTLSLHDALPISAPNPAEAWPALFVAETPGRSQWSSRPRRVPGSVVPPDASDAARQRSEEHTSELQSRQYLVCRLLLEKKKYSMLLLDN